MRALLVAILAWVLCLPAAASAEACRTVRGRMFMANGTPSVRIWVVGTRRILGVVQPNQSFEDLPANLRQVWAARGDEAMWASDLFGDFRVCAHTPSRPGWMQMVRVVGASKLRLRVRP